MTHRKKTPRNLSPHLFVLWIRCTVGLDKEDCKIAKDIFYAYLQSDICESHTPQQKESAFRVFLFLQGVGKKLKRLPFPGNP